MTLMDAIGALCRLEQSLTISDPLHLAVKRAFPFSPDRKQALTDTPCWINSWALSDTLSWGDLRIERYTVTSQLFIHDADMSRGATIASRFNSALLDAWDTAWQDMGGTTVGTDIRGREPTLGLLMWAEQSYPGLTVMIDLDVPVAGTPLFVDPVLSALRSWVATALPGWQQDPATWRPTNDAPGIYWHYVMYPVALESEPLAFDYSWMEATVAARLVTPGCTARAVAIRDLAHALARTSARGSATATADQPIAMADGSWMHTRNLRAFVEPDTRAQGQFQMDVRFLLDDGQDAAAEPIKTAVLAYADTEGGLGPTITATFEDTP